MAAPARQEPQATTRQAGPAAGMVPSQGGITIALAQLDAEPFDLPGNAERGAAAIREAAARGARVVVLPELMSTGYVMDRAAIHEAAERVDGGGRGPCLARWKRAARDEHITVVAGLAERRGSEHFNSAVVISDGGEVLDVYRKLHLYDEEHRVFSPGDRGLPIVDLAGLRLGVLICYDLRFPESLRILALQGADVVAVPTAWVAGFDHGPTPFPGMIPQVANAIVQANVNQVSVAAAGRTGRDGDAELLGSSVLVDPYGRPVAGPLARDGESVATGEIPAGSAQQSRSRGPGINPRDDRRTDLYGHMLGYRPPTVAAVDETSSRSVR